MWLAQSPTDSLYPTAKSIPMPVAETLCTSPREHIRNVALCLFVEQGFQAVSLRQLASAAGMQAGSLYNHFESKQALLFELIESYETELLHALPTFKSPGADPLKALGIFVRAHLHFTLRQDQRSRLTRMEFRCLEQEQQVRIQHLRTVCSQRLTAILHHGIERQVFKPDDRRRLVAHCGRAELTQYLLLMTLQTGLERCAGVFTLNPQSRRFAWGHDRRWRL
jgi:AcrR family transcriptional regulator